MKLGMIGLGRMGGNLVRRLHRHGHECIVFDENPEQVAPLIAEGATPAESVSDLCGQLDPPRVVWLMLPAGDPTESTIEGASETLEAGDILIDGGNSHYKLSARRARELAQRGIEFLDVGTSGGIWGLDRGYCLMIGGSRGAFEQVEPVFRDLAEATSSDDSPSGPHDSGRTAERGYLYCGAAGSGHCVKMIHNGIEYALMQGYAEGFALLRSVREGAPEAPDFELDLADIAELWSHGSVISSWLLELTGRALTRSPGLEEYSGFVEDSGEGRWTVELALESAVPTPTIADALFARFRSRQEASFADRLLSALRQEFGGHVEPGAEE